MKLQTMDSIWASAETLSVKDEKNAIPSIPIYPKICFVKPYIRFLQKALVSPQLQFDTTP